MKRLIAGAAGLIVAGALLGDIRALAANRSYEVSIDNFSFGPSSLTVAPGATVTWINHDDVPHIVVSQDGKEFKSPVLDTDEKFTRAFPRPGTYKYYCSIHPQMTGSILVK